MKMFMKSDLVVVQYLNSKNIGYMKMGLNPFVFLTSLAAQVRGQSK